MLLQTICLVLERKAICAFANDMPGSGKKGYLLIGVYDDGKISGMKVDDALMKRISGIRSDGNILPLPVMTTEKVQTDEGDVLVVEVTPSFDTPVRYRGRTFIRIGPRRDIASAEEERILAERCKEYLPKAIDAETLATDSRPLKEQLASLRLFNMQWDCPTYAALIMFGKNPKYFMPGAYIQFVRFKGETNGGMILNERRFEGCLYKMLPNLENFIRDGIVTKRPVPISILREKDVRNYPYKALRELMMNAVMHRDYQANMPTRLYQYDHHIEIMNPGGLYGQARPENFPHVNDYRNSVVAEMMKNLNYVNMFNHGVSEVQDLLKDNKSPAAEFNVNLVTAFSVIVREPEAAETMQKDPDTMQKTIQKDPKTIQKEDKESDEIKREMSDVLKNVLKDVQKDVLKEVSERQIVILETIYISPEVTLQEMSRKLHVSEKTIQREFTAIRKLGINIERHDGRKEGKWVIIVK